MQMIYAIQWCNQSDIQHDKRINSLIPENEISNKSKNPAPVYDERTAYLWIRRLEMSRKVLPDRAYTYITYTLSLIMVQRSTNPYTLVSIPLFLISYLKPLKFTQFTSGSSKPCTIPIR